MNECRYKCKLFFLCINFSSKRRLLLFFDVGTNKTQEFVWKKDSCNRVEDLNDMNGSFFLIGAEETLRRCTMWIPTPTGNALDWMLAGRCVRDLKSQPSSCCESSQRWSKKGKTLRFNEEWKEGRSCCEVHSRLREQSGALFRVFGGSTRTSDDVDSC